MEEEENHFSTEKVEKICKRLQLLLGQWVDTIPIISDVSASTLISQIHYYSTNLKTCSNQLEWANHEIAFLLIQTVSQLWDKEDNVNILIKNDILNTIKDMYCIIASILLPIQSVSTDDNRFAEFLNILSTIFEIPSDSSSKENWLTIYNSLQETFLPLFLHDLLSYPTTMVENKRQLCFAIIGLFTNNPRTIIKIFSIHQEELQQVATSLFTHEDFPIQCTILEILYRIFLMSQAISNQSLISLLSTSSPITLSQLQQNHFIEDGRELINQYNQQHSTNVQSLPLSSVYILLPSKEESLGSVSWLDFGNETISCYLEIEDSSHTKELQLLSIRWTSIHSFDYIDRAYSLRISFLIPQNMDADFLFPYLTDRNTLLCLRFSFLPEHYSSLSSIVNQYSSKLSCSIQSIKPTTSLAIPLPTTPSTNTISFSQPIRGCKSSVVAMDQYTPQTKPTKSSIATLIVPETQDTPLDPTPLLPTTELLFPEDVHTTPPSKPIDALSSLHSTPKRPSSPVEEKDKEIEENVLKDEEIEENAIKEEDEMNVSKKKETREKKQEKEQPKKGKAKQQLASLSRRKGMTFLSQLLTTNQMESGYKRKWNLPKRPSLSDDEETEKKEIRKDVTDHKEGNDTNKSVSEKISTQMTKETEKNEESSIKDTVTTVTTEKTSTKTSTTTTKPLTKPLETTTKSDQIKKQSTTTTKPKEQKRAQPAKPTSRKRNTTTQIEGRKKTKVSEKPVSEVKKMEVDNTTDTSDIENETHVLVDQLKTILSTPKCKLPDSIESSPLSNGSESDDEEPSILALQQAITTILLQQKKEKEKQLLQTKKQLETTMKENSDKMLHSTQLQLESILKTKKEEAIKLKESIASEIHDLEKKRESYEKECQSHLTTIQQLQQQYSSINQSLDVDSLIQSSISKYTTEINKLNEKLITDYKRKVKTIKKKSAQKKRFEIQKLVQLTFNSLTDCE